MKQVVPILLCLLMLPAAAEAEPEWTTEASFQGGYTLILPKADGGFTAGASALVRRESVHFGFSGDFIGTLSNQRRWAWTYDPALGFLFRGFMGKRLQGLGEHYIALEFGLSGGMANLGSGERAQMGFVLQDIGFRARRHHFAAGVGLMWGMRYDAEAGWDLATGVRLTLGYAF